MKTLPNICCTHSVEYGIFLETTQYYQFHFIVNNWIVVTFESVHEIMLCDHSNEMSFLLLLQDATLSASQHFDKMKFGNFVRFRLFSLLGVMKGLR